MQNGKTVTTGLVLRVTETKEADKILTVLTPDMGKIPLIARGARRKNSRIAAASQLLAYSELTLYKRGNWHMLDEASTLELFDGVRQDIELLSLASYFAEMTECVTAEDEPVPEILSLLLNSLYALDTLFNNSCNLLNTLKRLNSDACYLSNTGNLFCGCCCSADIINIRIKDLVDIVPDLSKLCLDEADLSGSKLKRIDCRADCLGLSVHFINNSF